MGASALATTGFVNEEKLKEARLDAKKKGVKWYPYGHKAFLNNPNNWTIKGGKKAFLNSPALQEQAMDRLLNHNERQLRKAGVINNSTPTDVKAGYLQAAHLKGVGGAIALSKGKDSTDAKGTSASSYFKSGKNSVKPPIYLTKAGEELRFDSTRVTKKEKW